MFKVRNNKETFVYRTDLASDKKVLLAQFRQAAEELSAKRRKEREEEESRAAEAAAVAASETMSALKARVMSSEETVLRLEWRLGESERSRGELDRRRRALESSLEKIGAFLRSKGIAVTSDDEHEAEHELDEQDDIDDAD